MIERRASLFYAPSSISGYRDRTPLLEAPIRNDLMESLSPPGQKEGLEAAFVRSLPFGSFSHPRSGYSTSAACDPRDTTTNTTPDCFVIRGTKGHSSRELTVPRDLNNGVSSRFDGQQSSSRCLGSGEGSKKGIPWSLTYGPYQRRRECCRCS